MNFVQIIGYIHTLPAKIPKSTSEKHSNFEIEVISNFREGEGNFRHDIFTVRLWQGATNAMYDYMRINALIAIKGRLEFDEGDILIIAESFEYLRSK